MTEILDTKVVLPIDITMTDWDDPYQVSAEQPDLRLPNRRSIGGYMIAFGLGILLTTYLNSFEQQGGPEDGITYVNTSDCEVVDTMGPAQRFGSKFTVRVIDPRGQNVIVGLKTNEVSEEEVREAGYVVDSQVTVNDLVIACVETDGLGEYGQVGGTLNLRQPQPSS